ncbi:MAG: hypothetical protein ACD_78C00071G0002 [uncultured bacterium (gcode 4)]|uniref:HD domain-containing protein n=1 Tax=uncultured bacterium (gcode 4) TaxID=1234023 RepID=K1XZH7_9BACT|nr:MAG: hypothetical protein ACD_78C00071G0002 [uncultured bacterium (gcode 4)]
MSSKHPHFHIRELRTIIGHIINDEDFKKLQAHRHHMFFNRYEHLLNASFFAYQLARLFRADLEVCALAWLLHDYHFTTLKSYSHAVIAAKNAERFLVTEEVVEIVRSHMYPLGRSKIKRACGRNFWVVKIADFSAAFFEISYSIVFLQFQHNRIKLKRSKLLMEMVGEE